MRMYVPAPDSYNVYWFIIHVRHTYNCMTELLFDCRTIERNPNILNSNEIVQVCINCINCIINDIQICRT